MCYHKQPNVYLIIFVIDSAFILIEEEVKLHSNLQLYGHEDTVYLFYIQFGKQLFLYIAFLPLHQRNLRADSVRQQKTRVLEVWLIRLMNTTKIIQIAIVYCKYEKY